MPLSTVARIQALCSWLQSDGIASSESEGKTWREECKALAAQLHQEEVTLIKLAANIHQITPHDRLQAALSLLTSCVHSSDAATAKLPYDTISKLQRNSVIWISFYLDVDPEPGLPSRTQLAVAEVLLRAEVLQGCSRQLASATAAVAAATRKAYGRRPRARAPEETPALDDALGNTESLLRPLAKRCKEWQLDSPAQATGQRASPSTMPGCDGSEGQADVVKQGVKMQMGKKEQEGGLQGPEADPGAVEQLLQPAGLQQQLLAALYDSSVLEHVARGVLVQSGYLQRMEQAGRQLGLGFGGLAASCVFFATLYADLVHLQDSPELAGAGSRPQRDAGGAQAQAPAGDAAPPATPHQQHASTPTPPLAAPGHGLDSAHMSLLHRVLSGPCARHLVLCQGLRTLCALDGGGFYGLPWEAGLWGLPLCRVLGKEEEVEEQPQHLRVDGTPLCNLVDMLAMRPRGDPEAEAQLPSRGTRLQLTLRVARAAAGAGSSGSGSGGGGCQRSPLYVLDQAQAAFAAVTALERAWRHMPPPRGPARLDRRRAALRRWAAAAEQVARSGVVTGAHPTVAYRLGLLLGLHPSAVGPLVPQDLPSLASGGHLLRASEVLVSQVARAVGEQARANQSNPAGGTHRSSTAGSALRALIGQRGCDIRSCPLRNLLLQPGEDEQPGAGQVGQGSEVAGAAGQGGGCSRAAASLAVALGKLLRRCEGVLVGAIGRCSNSKAGDEGENALALGAMLCGVLLTCPCCDTPNAKEGAAAGGRLGEDGEQLGWGWEARRSVWVCSYATWQWLPALAGVARRAAAAGHVNQDSLLAWQACLAWVTRLCLACCRKSATGEVELEASEGHGGCEDSGTAVVKGGGAQPSPDAAGDIGGSCAAPSAAVAGDSCSCRCGGSGEPGGCWREFLLQDVGVVGLLGAALSGLVPELLAGEEEDCRHLLAKVAEACVLAAMAFPAEVAQYAWGPQGGAANRSGGGSSGASNSGSSSAAVWSPKVLAELAAVVGREEAGQPLAGALRALEQWSEACGRMGGAVGPSAEETQLLERAVADMLCDAELAGWSQHDAALLPPLCELRALLRVCSNPRCVALPPLGQTEAEAEAEARGGRGAGLGASCAPWYCCMRCRKQAGRAGQGQAQQG